MRIRGCFIVLLYLCVHMFLFPMGISHAEEATDRSSSGYLSEYQEPQPQQSRTSWWSTAAYLFSLIVVFAFVAVLAYVVSKFLGNRLGRAVRGNSGRVLTSLPLGANKGVFVVEIAGKVMVLGVTEQKIALMDTITDELEIAKLRSEANHANVDADADFQNIFEKQMASLEQISRKIPSILGDRRNRK